MSHSIYNSSPLARLALALFFFLDWAMLPEPLKQEIIFVSCSRDSTRLRPHFVLLGDERHPPYLVKYHQPRLKYESRTLEYLYGLASNDPDAPRIPKLIAYFQDSWGRGYLVMEYISSPVVTLEAWIEDVKSKDDQYKRVDIEFSVIPPLLGYI
ncbi:hypothetical protein H0H92_002220 [Tricholoma furcatifolium]|nr:hypothetical protein H0H92_002220 [Tricholoma furcatifolium]